MKCPHCEYEHGWSITARDEDGSMKKIVGLEGEFWSLPVRMERDNDGYYCTREQSTLMACPACNKTFIDEG